MTIRFQQEDPKPLFDEAQPLLHRHFAEVAHYQDIPLNPDRDMYFAAADNGALRAFTVRVDERLVGYAVFFVRRNAHYSSSLQAVQDILFVVPEYRASKIGAGLIRFCEDVLRDEGVQVVYHHMKVRPDLNFGPLLERMGYELIDLVFGKRLDRG